MHTTRKLSAADKTDLELTYLEGDRTLIDVVEIEVQYEEALSPLVLSLHLLQGPGAVRDWWEHLMVEDDKRPLQTKIKLRLSYFHQ